MAKKRKNKQVEETKMTEQTKPNQEELIVEAATSVGEKSELDFNNVWESKALDDVTISLDEKDTDPNATVEIVNKEVLASNASTTVSDNVGSDDDLQVTTKVESPEPEGITASAPQEPLGDAMQELSNALTEEEPKVYDPLGVFLEGYADKLGAHNQATVSDLHTYQRRLYNEIIAAIHAPNSEGLARLNKIVTFMQSDERGAFTMSRMFRGLGDSRVIKNANDANEARELFALLLTIVNPKKDNKRYISWERIQDLLQPKNADRAVMLFRALVGENEE